MRPVRRDEILDWATYAEVRPRFRGEVLAVKVPRRVHLGPNLTLLFENPLTVRYQIQEMIWAERIVREADIQHEIETYNELLGGEGELGCTLLIEIEDPQVRAARLAEWLDLPQRIVLLHADGSRTRAQSDARQRDGDKLSAVQFLKFDVGGRVPIGAAVSLPGLEANVRFEPATMQALAADLAGKESALE